MAEDWQQTSKPYAVLDGDGAMGEIRAVNGGGVGVGRKGNPSRVVRKGLLQERRTQVRGKSWKAG